MSKKTLSLNKNLVVHKPPAKNTFYEKYYLQNVKKLQELHDKLCRTPTVADIRSLINCETEQAEKLYNLYISDDKRNKDCQASLPNFLLKALNHAVNIIIAEKNTDIHNANIEIAKQNEFYINENKILVQQNKNLQSELLEMQQKLNAANTKIKELNNDKLVEFLKQQLENLQNKYDGAINTLFKTPKTKTKPSKVKTDLPITSLEDLFKK